MSRAAADRRNRLPSRFVRSPRKAVWPVGAASIPARKLGQGTIRQVGCEVFDDHIAVLEQRFGDGIRGSTHTHHRHRPSLVTR